MAPVRSRHRMDGDSHPGAVRGGVRADGQRVDAIAAGSAAELVWLLEHPPLYTAGTSAKPEPT